MQGNTFLDEIDDESQRDMKDHENSSKQRQNHIINICELLKVFSQWNQVLCLRTQISINIVYQQKFPYLLYLPKMLQALAKTHVRFNMKPSSFEDTEKITKMLIPCSKRNVLTLSTQKWTNRRCCEGVVFKTWKQTKCRRERDMTLNRERQSDNQSKLFLVLSRPHLMFCVFAKSPQCLQSSLFETLRISFTLYLTNCFHSPVLNPANGCFTV